MNLLRQKCYKKTITYFSINHIYAISKLNIRDVMNLTYQKQFKSIMLRFSFLKKCYKDSLRIIIIIQMSSTNQRRIYYLHIAFMITN